jgi:hypothetical protein
MIVELLDYRSPTGKEPALDKPESTRVVLHPSPETLWADLCLANDRAGRKWNDLDVLKIESRIIVCVASFLEKVDTNSFDFEPSLPLHHLCVWRQIHSLHE